MEAAVQIQMPAEVQEVQVQDPGKLGYVYIIGNLFRRGVASFISELEYVHYPPDTSANDRFNVFHMTYQGMVHVIVEIPSRDIGLCQPMAARYGLKVVPGKPHNPGGEQFALKCGDGCCFTLEFIDAKDVLVSHPDYLASLNDEIVAAITKKAESPDTDQ